MSEEFKIIETQEDFDKAIQKRLARAEREAAEKFQEYLAPDQVEKLKKEYEEKLKKAEEDLNAAKEKMASHDQIVADLTTRATTAEDKLLKGRIANDAGIPYELAGRLVGNNEEELKKDAEQLASYLAPKSAPPLKTSETFGGATGAQANINADMASMLSQISTQLSGGN
jgi:hypothetical protein